MSGGNVGVWGWDTANTEWVKMLVDNLGHVQVDVVTSGLPVGGATAANQATIIGHIDDIETNLGRCYGWDGAAWQTLLVESAALKNLRVKLYDGANSIDSQDVDTHMTTERGLAVCAAVYGYDGVNVVRRVNARTSSLDAEDNAMTILAVQARLYGWNGVFWVRPRVGTVADAYTTPPYAQEVMSFLMGYNGADWNMLRMESAAQHNLRVAIFDGAQQAYIGSMGSDNISVSRNGLTVMSHLYGFDGTNWDRLRVDASANLMVNVNAVGATLSSADSFGGNVYSKTMTMADDNPTRFEAASKKLRDIVIIVKTHPMLLGETGVVVYPVGVNEAVGFTKVDISTLYFQNAGAGNNGVITIIGTEE